MEFQKLQKWTKARIQFRVDLRRSRGANSFLPSPRPQGHLCRRAQAHIKCKVALIAAFYSQTPRVRTHYMWLEISPIIKSIMKQCTTIDSFKSKRTSTVAAVQQLITITKVSKKGKPLWRRKACLIHKQQLGSILIRSPYRKPLEITNKSWCCPSFRTAMPTRVTTTSSLAALEMPFLI